MATLDSRIAALEKIHLPLPQTLLDELLGHEMLDDDGQEIPEYQKFLMLEAALQRKRPTDSPVQVSRSV